MTTSKCYTNQCGETFVECVKTALDDVMNCKRKKTVTLIFDGIPLMVDKTSTYKSILQEYQIKSSRH